MKKNIANARSTIVQYYQKYEKSLVEQNISLCPQNNFLIITKQQNQANPLDDKNLFSNKEKYEMVGKYDTRKD